MCVTSEFVYVSVRETGFGLLTMNGYRQKKEKKEKKDKINEDIKKEN